MTPHQRFLKRVRLALIAVLALAAAPSREQANVTYLPSEESPLVAVRVIFGAGSQYDPPGKEGLAALTASLVAQGGTQELTYEQVLGKFYPMAADLSGSCFKEVTVFAGEVHRDNLEAYADLIGAMITEPRFAAEDFERLRTQAIVYLTNFLRGGSDEELGKSALLLQLYPEPHPYGHVDVGTVEALKSLTLEEVKEFHRNHYTQDNLYLGVAGGSEPEFVESFEKMFTSLPQSEVPLPELPRPEQPKGLEVFIVEKPSAEATAISIGFPLPITRSDDDFYPLFLANSYLGEHRTFNGKLMQDLRGKRGLNYGTYSYIEDFVQAGSSTFPVPNNPRRQQAFTIWIRPVAHENAVFALRAALWELDRLVQDGISPDDFEATRSFLLNYSNLWTQTLSRRLGYTMEGEFYGRKDLATELQAKLPELTVDQVNSAVQRYLKTPGLKVAVVTRDAEGLAELLRSGEPTPMTYDTEGTPEGVLAEDKVIERFPLRNVSIKIVPVQEMFEK